jgi:hypothetical protein
LTALTAAEGEKRLKKLEKALGKEGIEFRPESYKWSIVQVGLMGWGVSPWWWLGAELR